MSGYGRFACYYDKLTENVDYGKIAARCHELIKRYSSEHEVVLDLACGTGSLSEALARLDYDVVGVDLSDQMLEEAMDKRYESGLNIQYLMQDMTELDLYGAVDAVVCVLDSINHLENEEAVRKTFECVSKFTCDGGLFIFDVNTVYKDFTERIYTDEFLSELVKSNDFELIGKYDGFEDSPVNDKTQRVLYVCRRINRG